MIQRIAIAAVWISVGLGNARAGEPFAQDSNRQLFAIVIGSNSTGDPAVQPLRYADDDAVQNATLLGQLGAQVVLLVDLDRQTRALYPELEASPPTIAAVQAAMATLNRLMDEARARGKTPVLYFVYSGHGDVQHNQGLIHLDDGSLQRDQFLTLMASSRAAINHVIVDACKSYFFIFERGAGSERRPLRGGLVRETKGLPANTGVLLSTSAAVDSHEWEAYQGGIFSHQVRSALRGAADVDGDGRVTYEETAAFVWTANSAIPNQRYRPIFFARAPSKRYSSGALIADLRDATGDHLIIGPGIDRRMYVENSRGLRLLDAHPGQGQRVDLLIPELRPMFVREPDTGMEAEVPKGSRIILSELTLHASTAQARGAEHVAFSLLFAHPFDAAAVASYRVRPEETLAEERKPVRSAWLRNGLGISALVVGTLGGTMTALAAKERNDVGSSTSGYDRSLANHQIDRFNGAAIACYAVAGALAVGYVSWTIWARLRPVKIRLQPSPTPQASLSVSW